MPDFPVDCHIYLKQESLRLTIIFLKFDIAHLSLVVYSCEPDPLPTLLPLCEGNERIWTSAYTLFILFIQILEKHMNMHNLYGVWLMPRNNNCDFC